MEQFVALPDCVSEAVVDGVFQDFDVLLMRLYAYDRLKEELLFLSRWLYVWCNAKMFFLYEDVL